MAENSPNQEVPRDVIFCGDARQMAELPDRCVQLVVTSPPYNVGKAYADHPDNLPLDEYLALLNQVWRECYRVLVSGGRLCINVANTDRKPYLPLNALITGELLRMAREEGLAWLMRGEIIWDKGASVGVSTAWGSFARASDPVLRDVHEYIMVFSKETFKLAGGGSTGITGGQFVEWTRSIWRPEEQLQPTKDGQGLRSLAELQRKLAAKLADARRRGKDDAWIAESMARAAWQYFTEPAGAAMWRRIPEAVAECPAPLAEHLPDETAGTVWPMTTETSVPHPAPFPVELPRRLILLYTSPGDLVLDPFMGAGATAVAAVQTGRHYVGYEVSERYCELARKRVERSR